MPDFLDTLALDAMRTVEEGYYDNPMNMNHSPISMRDAILESERAPIISEIKFASPSEGRIRSSHDLKGYASEMVEGGAIGVSILTEPKHFKGHIDNLAKVRGVLSIPTLMKDIILRKMQIDAASRIGADAVLLIKALFDRGYSEKNIQYMINYTHSRGLDVLLEVHTEEEFLSALETSADMIGINNRDLSTLEVDLSVTKRILTEYSPEYGVFVSESGINTPEDIRLLRACGVQGFLIGTAIMKADNIREKVKELVEAL
ncbi:MAG: indole-3-glycerol-phosphate synthase [Candidatus Bathyarchaeia archaeon]